MRNDLRAEEPTYLAEADEGEGIGLLDLDLPLAQHLKQLIAGPLLAGVLALGVSYLVSPTFTAKTVIIPPSQSQGGAAAALSSLGALANLAGVSVGGMKNQADQYVGLIQSTTIADRIVERFKLMEVYDAQYRQDARKTLSENVRVSLGKKDGLITVEVDDHDPQRAAEMANQFVAELRTLSSGLALSEAQQRRVFFEAQLKQARDNLTTAQQALEASGFNQGAIKAEPQAAAEAYAKLRAEATLAEVKLQALRSSLSDNAPEVQQILAQLSTLRSQLARLESNNSPQGSDANYVGKFREFKYQEQLFEVMAKQYELARVDESREGTMIQVVDVATPPERKSKPKRSIVALATTFVTLLLMAGFFITRHFWRRSAASPENTEKLTQLRAALRRS